MSFDSVQENADFAQKFSFTFPLLCDTERQIGLAYGACDDKTDRSARRISYLIGPDGRIEHAWPKVEPKKHPAEVLALLP